MTTTKARQLPTMSSIKCYGLARYFYPEAGPKALNQLATELFEAVENAACAHDEGKLCQCWVKIEGGPTCPYKPRGVRHIKVAGQRDGKVIAKDVGSRWDK